ncbi:MAG: hypothetical protein GY746_15760, partial [Gammaproteobacteria bacterium]|nr:hypothetical protein [Gammaproteobacteria bacterium]
DAKLHVVGDVKIVDGTQGADKVLTSDAAGLASWQVADTGSDDQTLSISGDTLSIEDGNSIIIPTTASIFELYGDTVRLDTRVVDIATANFVFGSPQLDNDGISDHVSRMFFDKGKSAFRVGSATGTNWDTDNLGIYSVAFGLNTKATGIVSTAVGYKTDASGFSSTAMGAETRAVSAYETAIGRFNTDYTPNDTIGWDAADRLFVIGNGQMLGTKSNALTIYKNGKMNINDAYDMPTADGTSGQVLTTDGSGAASWQAASTVVDTLSIISDTDNDTKIQVEESADDDIIRFDMAGTEFFRMDSGRLEVVNTGGSVFIGDGAGANDDFSNNLNVAVGESALSSNTSGSGNTANGFHSLYANTTGNYNTANGIYALYGNTTGRDNTANGMYALFVNRTGYNNTANGKEALFENTTGNYNTANGWDALFFNTTGSNNTATGVLALLYNTSGGYNTASGSQALAHNRTGTFNTALGFDADVSTGNLTNATAIGAHAEVSQDNSLVLGSINGVNGATSDVNVGIGTNTPDSKLHVVGSIKMVDGNQVAGYIPVSDAAGVMTWTDPASISTGSIFELHGDTVRLDTSVVDIATANFVFGSPRLNDDENSDHDSRMFFDKSLGAFRVGIATGTNWDTGNLGTNSVAFGYDTKAKGQSSTAMGAWTKAIGNYSTAMGYQTNATDESSTAMGGWTKATGFASTAMCYDTEATGQYSTAMGSYTQATGNSSTAMGSWTTATGESSMTMGFYTEAESAYETAIGSYNTDYTPNSTTSWNAADRLFVVGNGTAWNATSDAMVVLKSGNTGFGTSTPDTTMHIVGGLRYEDGNEASGYIPVSDADGVMTWTDPASISTASIFELYGDTVRLDTSVVDITAANFVFGSPQLDDDGISDHDSRMFFDKGKAAFRVGTANGTEWDTDSLGENSVAFGNDTKATGAVSMAI